MNAPRRPHDPTDLYLAPVALALDHRLEELAALTVAELEARVALDTNSDPRDAAHREKALLGAVTYLIDLHGWKVGVTSRGLALSHRDRVLVLGFPQNVHAYLER